MKKALIIIDMQNEFCLESKVKIKDNYQSIISPINDLSSSFRENGLKVFWVNWSIEPSLENISNFQKEKFNNFEYPPSMSWKKKLNKSKKVLERSSWSADIVSPLKQSKNDVYISKQRVSGFWYTNLNEQLKDHNITELYFAGINTDQCVLATLQDAHCIGYNCYLVEDCTSTSSPDYCFQAALYNIENCFGSITNSTLLLFK